jgi:regulator of protease activity HflC (stomatin/prohibitin superfamily)
VIAVLELFGSVGQFFNSEMFGWMPEPVKYILVSLIALVALVITVFKMLEIVHEGNRGMRTRFKKVVLRYDKGLDKHQLAWQKQVDKDLLASNEIAQYGRPSSIPPGLASMIPFVNNFVIVDIRAKRICLDDFIVRSGVTSYGGVRLNEVVIYVRITQIYVWSYRYEMPMEYIKDAANAELSRILALYSSEDLAILEERIIERFTKAMVPHLTNVGAQLDSVFLGPKNEMAQEGWLAQAVSELPFGDISKLPLSPKGFNPAHLN